MWHCISTIWASAVPAGTQSAATPSPLPLTSSSYSLTSSSSSTHATHFILSTSRRNTDTDRSGHNMARDISLELGLLVHAFLSTTIWEATESSCRMDMGCPFPCLFRVRSQTKNLFQILFFFLLAFFFTSF